MLNALRSQAKLAPMMIHVYILQLYEQSRGDEIGRNSRRLESLEYIGLLFTVLVRLVHRPRRRARDVRLGRYGLHHLLTSLGRYM